MAKSKADLRFLGKKFKTEKELKAHVNKVNRAQEKAAGKKFAPMFDPYTNTGKLKKPGAITAWFKRLSKKAQAAYIKKHPNSKFAKASGKKAFPIKNDPKAKKSYTALRRKMVAGVKRKLANKPASKTMPAASRKLGDWLKTVKPWKVYNE